MKKIFIIILNWNGKKDTIECLKSLQELRRRDQKSLLPQRGIINYELGVVVVDNGSTDGSVPEIKNETLRLRSPRPELGTKAGRELKIIENKENLGFAEGNNVGLRYALENGMDYMMLLNNDTLVDKDLVAQLLEAAESDPQIGLVSPKIYFAKGYEFYKDRYKKDERGRVIWYAGGKIDWENILGSHRGVDEVDHGQYDNQEETDFATGCCLLVKKDVVEKIGPLDKKYFAYWEDTDFCQRAKMAGFKVVYTPKAILWHKNASSSGKPGSKMHQYYQTRNRLLFGFRYASLRAKLALFRESLKFFLGGGIKRKAVLDFYFGRLGRGSYQI